MTDTEQKLVEFLSSVPDKFIFSEHGRRMARVKKEKGNVKFREKLLRQCRFCDLFFGGRDMRLHVAEAHPGGAKRFKPKKTNPEVPRACKECGEVFGARKLRLHMVEVHGKKSVESKDELEQTIN